MMSVQNPFLETFKASILPLTLLVCAVIWGCVQSLEFLRFSVWLILVVFAALGSFYSGTAAEKNHNSIFMGVIFILMLALLVTLLIKGVPFIFEGENLGLF